MQQNRWENELKQGLRTAEDLCNAGFIDHRELPAYERVLSRYRFLVTPYYADLIDKSNPRCPIRAQAIPSLQEEAQTWKADPLGDLQHQPAPRVTHRYHNRALLHLAPNCSMYCRYCFRKSLLNDLRDDFFVGELTAAFTYLKNTPAIAEVILSGGDPFMVSDSQLANVTKEIAGIPHVKKLRVHTRVPVTLPSRITDTLIHSLSNYGKALLIVTHFNHPKEITKESTQACRKLMTAGHTVYNQSVLLKGVNDCPGVLKELLEKLFSIDVLPYYLHHPDQAEGTKHFDISIEEGLSIFRLLQSQLPKSYIPRYVIDDGGTDGKKDVSTKIHHSPGKESQMISAS